MASIVTIWAKDRLGIVALLLVLGATPGCQEPDPEKAKACRDSATDHCIPHVDLGDRLRVGDLIWEVRRVRTARTIGDPRFLGATADGRYVIVTLRVRSARDATLLSDSIALELGGRSYDAGAAGLMAASGADAFFLIEKIEAGAVTTVRAVFDVPESALSKKAEMRFKERFSARRGYIDISSRLG